MKSYLDLVPQYEKVHRKSSRISVLCIVISVLLVTAIFSMADMALRAEKGYFIKTNGEYHISLKDIDGQTAELLASRPDVSVCGWACQGSSGLIGEQPVLFAGANERVFSTLTEMNMRSGVYPAQSGEALLNQAALVQTGLALGDTVTVTVPDGSQKEYRITGVLEDMGSLLNADVYGMVLTEDGFREIADENAKEGTSFRIQFKRGVNIQAAIRQIKEAYGLNEDQVGENSVLLGLMGQSENSTMQSLYIVAAFLFLLVLIAGTVMIAAGFNTNVLERVQFYGLLRCLGASKKQVKRLVVLQGLRQSIRGVPSGLVLGQILSWCACLLLKSVSGERFSEIPLFAFSVGGLLAGTAVGFLIVLLASLSPAKRAASVPPVTAVRGNAQLTRNKKAANTKLFRIETGMGIFHALSGRKNLFLMTCSFAISIMMFLSFQVLVTFLNQGMPALAPSAADVSITAGAAPLERTLCEEIRSIDGVDTVFGRMEQTDVAASCGSDTGTLTLLSYTDRQFEWAKRDLTQGAITSTQNEPGYALITYRGGPGWKVGDPVTLHSSASDRQLTIGGILTTASAANRAGSCGYLICSEQTFIDIAGDSGYTAIDVQLSDSGSDDTVSAIRRLIPADSTVSDKRLTNAEAQSSYATGAVFIYGFLMIIALITVFHIFNSMNASVASRTRQYGIMRAVGMGEKQLYKMIAAEAFTYAILGCAAGCALGLPLNRAIFRLLIADKWGSVWTCPTASLLLIVFLCLVSAAVAIRRPVRQLSKLSIVDTIHTSV